MKPQISFHIHPDGWVLAFCNELTYRDSLQNAVIDFGAMPSPWEGVPTDAHEFVYVPGQRCYWANSSRSYPLEGQIIHSFADQLLAGIEGALHSQQSRIAVGGQ